MKITAVGARSTVPNRLISGGGSHAAGEFKKLVLYRFWLSYLQPATCNRQRFIVVSTRGGSLEKIRIFKTKNS
jgi:hypothetical protein